MACLKSRRLPIILIGMISLMPQHVYAMHIMEGFLPVNWAVIWMVISVPFVVFGIKKIKKLSGEHLNIKMLLGLCGAFAFVLSSLKIPSVTGSCSHPTGVGLAAILFGPSVACIMSLIVLLFQALLLAHGGLTTLGANVFSMGIAGPLVAYYVYKAMSKSGASTATSVFLAASLADLITYLMTSIQLGLAFPAAEGGIIVSMAKFMGIFAFTQVPLALSEGMLTVIVFNLLLTYNKSDMKELEVFGGNL
jgi:cobalt/nickel transport system permease protein